MKARIITEIISFATIVLFLYTGINKVADFYTFQQQIALVSFLEPMAARLAWALPLTEFVTASLLFFPKTRLIGFYAALIMMIGFTTYVAVILGGNEKLPCSCGGIIELLSWKQHLVFNGCFVLFEMVGIYLQRKITRQEKSIYPSFESAL